MSIKVSLTEAKIIVVLDYARTIFFEQSEKFYQRLKGRFFKRKMKTRAQKTEDISKISEKLTRAKAIVLTDYKGMNMKQLSELRSKLLDQNAEFNVTKNTLLNIALKNSTAYHLSPVASFKGPIATLFAYDDEISPIKTLVKALKDNSIGQIKFGFLGSELLDAAKVAQLSTLPSKDELRAKTVGILVAPLQGIVGVLQANLRNLVYALSEIQKVKGGEQISS